MDNSGYSYPDPMASAKEKGTAKYILQYGKAMYHHFNRSGYRMFLNDRQNYKKRTAYAQGNQPVDPYKKRLDCWDDEAGADVYVNINWQILNLATKLINIMIGKIVKLEYDSICTPIDPVSVDAKRQRRSMMEAYQENEKFFADMGIGLSKEQLGFDPAIMPKTSDEMDIHMDMHDKDRMALEAELAIELAKQNNNFEQVRKEYIMEMVYHGIGAVEERNNQEGITKIKNLHTESVIAGNSKSEDFKDISHAGYVENITFGELKVLAQSQFTDDQYKDIYENHFKKTDVGHGNDPSNVNSYGRSQHQSEEKTGTIMKFYFKSTNTQPYEKKKDSRGNRRMYPTEPGKGSSKEYKEKYIETGEREIITDSYEVVYEGTWIVGTEFVFNYGLLVDMEVTKSNMCETNIPIHIFAPNMYDGKVVSVVNEMIPILDEIQVNWLQFQHAISKYIPDGPSVDIDGLLNVAMGKGGKNMTPKELMKMFYKTGTHVYKGSQLNGQNGNGKPIQILTNSNSESAGAFLNNVFTLINVLRGITGLNESADASTPSADALVGTSQLALAGTENALEYLYHGDRMMLKHIAESTVLLTQNAVKRRKISGFVNALGESSARFWEVNKDISLREFGIEVNPRPSGQERAAFLTTLGNAYAKGTLSTADYLDLQQIKNLKLATQLMKVREKRNKAEADQANQANIQQQSQANQESAMAVEQAKQQTLQLDHKFNIELEMLKIQGEKEILQLKIDGELRVKAVDSQVKLDSKHIEADAKVVTKHMENETGMAVAEINASKAKKAIA